MKKWKLADILWPVAMFVFTFFVYASVNIYLGNQESFSFYIRDYLPCALVIAIPVVIVAVGLYILLKGKGKAVWAAVVFAVGVATFLQGSFLNPDYGTLDGRGIQWGDYAGYAVANTAIWVALIGAAVVFAILKWDAMKAVVRYGSILMLVYEAIMLAMMLFTNPVQWEGQDWVVTNRNANTLSSKNNTVIFLVDACDSTYFQKILDEEPQVVEDWDGFVYYSDFVGSYSKTKMSLTYLLSQKWYENEQPTKEFVAAAFDDVPLFEELVAADYDLGIYTSSKYISPSLMDKVGNLLPGHLIVADHFGLANQMLELTMFSYGPHLVKPWFEFYSGAFGAYYGTDNGEELYSKNNFTFAEMAAMPFELTDRNVFRFYHLVGSHLPCNMNAEGEYVGEWRSTAYEQTKGVFKSITAFMNQMKELGIYDDATIIVTADHGRFDEGVVFPTFVIKRPGAHGAVEVCDTPASQTEVHATILQCAGLEIPEGQTSIFDLDPDADYPRRFLYYPTTYSNEGFLPDLEEYTVSRGLVYTPTGRIFTKDGVVESGQK